MPLLFLLIGVASITETSSQAVDSGQVEDTRWTEVSSDVDFSDVSSVADSGYQSLITEEETREVCQKRLGR